MSRDETRMVRAHVFVSGLVQGVFFRMHTKRMADTLNVKGWVRNLRDGRVEAVFEGREKDVEKMIEWCKKGPSGAIVREVNVTFQEYRGEFKDFRIIY
ncbi:MAG: acylphosphatase [Nitrososphaerota archaeon]